MTMIRAARFGAGALAGTLVFLAFVSSAAAAETPKVVVTIKPVHALVSQIMGGVGTPTLLVAGSASPHTFTLRPSTARAINDADVFIRVSDTMEPFTRKIVKSLPSSVDVLTLTEAPGIALLDQRHGGTFEPHTHGPSAGAEHEDHDDHDEDGKDGHIWLDPQNAKAIVAIVTKTLVARYPEYAGKFTANAAALDQRLDALEQRTHNGIEWRAEQTVHRFSRCDAVLREPLWLERRRFHHRQSGRAAERASG